ncbi:MAG TPA: NADP-dependent oxidoreductase [Actinomycetes bacterium]|nr:NADP-dependent oxidoreductase [Actinomycetes bacterium]
MRAVLADVVDGSTRLSVQDIPVPHPGPGQVRVKVAAAGINPVDLGNLADPSWAGLLSPWIPGYDVAGVVDAVGDDVPHAAIGRRCMAMTRFPRGQGGYAEYTVVDEGLLGYLSDSADLQAATSIPLAAGTAQTVLQRLGPASGRMLVLGASGGVGLFLLQLAASGGVQVVGVGRTRNHDIMLRSGALGCVDYRASDYLATAVELAGGQFDTIVDLVGGSGVNAALAHLRDGGQICAIALPELDLDHVIDANQSFHGVLIRDDGDRTRELAALFDKGALKAHVTHALPLDEVTEAHRLVESGEAGGKVVLVP